MLTDTEHLSSDSWTNDSYELVLFSESEIDSVTSEVWIFNKWFLWTGSVNQNTL